MLQCSQKILPFGWLQNLSPTNSSSTSFHQTPRFHWEAQWRSFVPRLPPRPGSRRQVEETTANLSWLKHANWFNMFLEGVFFGDPKMWFLRLDLWLIKVTQTTTIKLSRIAKTRKRLVLVNFGDHKGNWEWGKEPFQWIHLSLYSLPHHHTVLKCSLALFQNCCNVGVEMACGSTPILQTTSDVEKSHFGWCHQHLAHCPYQVLDELGGDAKGITEKEPRQRDEAQNGYRSYTCWHHSILAQIHLDLDVTLMSWFCSPNLMLLHIFPF